MVTISNTLLIYTSFVVSKFLFKSLPEMGTIYVAFCLKELEHTTNFSCRIARFDPSNNAWSHVSFIPGLADNHLVRDFSMISIGNSIYIIGGRLCRKEKKIHSDFDELDEFTEVQVRVLSTVLCYNVESDRWSNCAPLHMPRYNFGCTVCGNKFYVAGGQCDLESAKSTSSVEMYDPSHDEWTLLPNMNRLRYKCVGVTWQGKVYMIGGFVNGCDMDAPYVGRCSAEVYNPQSEKWDLVSRMWQLDVPPNQIVAIDDRLFSSGDCLNTWKGHIEAYDGQLNLWYIVEGSYLKDFCSGAENCRPLQRLFVTMASIGNRLYFLAGYKVVGEASKTIVMVHSFDSSLSQGTWKRFEPILEEGEKELCGHCCVVTHE